MKKLLDFYPTAFLNNILENRLNFVDDVVEPF